MILNNNAVIALDENGNEVIVCGNGIGFSHRKGDYISSDITSKIFVNFDDENKKKLLTILDEVPLDCIEITDEIIKLAEKKLNKSLNKSLLINLADHINFTVKRYREAVTAPNLMNEEIKRFYQLEYSIGVEAVHLINDYYHIKLDEDEATAIAFHIINASDTMNNIETRKIIIGVRDIVDIVKDNLKVELDQDSLGYSRFVIHLKFFLKGVLTHNVANNNTKNEFLIKLLSETNPDIRHCLNNIDQYTKKIFGYNLTQEDRIYLTIHLLRILEN